MLDQVLPYLACPYCGGRFERVDRTLRCPAGHAFDVARQGYVNLLPGSARSGAGDTLAMVQARERFLASGRYAPVADAIVRAAAGSPADGCVVDIGAGTGHYLASVLGASPGHVGVALDRSKYAMRRAARAHARAGAVACDAWRHVPVRDDAASLLLNVFAPRNGAEFRRVLCDGGALVVVTPTARHLSELVEALDLLTVDAAKDDRVAATLDPYFGLDDREVLDVGLRLSHAEVRDLVAMGPSAYHVEPTALDRRVAALPEPMAVTLSVVVSTYR
ncbi:MAG: putative RNA methyltransferase [Streptosporangiales bacterium]